MTRALERRLERLESIFGKAGCACARADAVTVVDERNKTAEAIEREIEGKRTRCDVHGFVPAVIVQVRSFATETGAPDHE